MDMQELPPRFDFMRNMSIDQKMLYNFLIGRMGLVLDKRLDRFKFTLESGPLKALYRTFPKRIRDYFGVRYPLLKEI